MHMQYSRSLAPSQEPVFLTRIEGKLVAAGQPTCHSELPLSEGESAWAFPGDPGWAAHGAAQQEGWFHEPPGGVGDPSMHMTPPPWVPDSAYLGGLAFSHEQAWSNEGSWELAAGGLAQSGAAALKRRRPRLHQGFPSGPMPLRRACKNKRDKMDAYVEEVAAQLQANPFADISQVDVPQAIFNTPYLQKHTFMAIRELLKGCGRSFHDADFLLPASFTAGRRGSIAESCYA